MVYKSDGEGEERRLDQTDVNTTDTLLNSGVVWFLFTLLRRVGVLFTRTTFFLKKGDVSLSID